MESNNEIVHVQRVTQDGKHTIHIDIDINCACTREPSGTVLPPKTTPLSFTKANAEVQALRSSLATQKLQYEHFFQCLPKEQELLKSAENHMSAIQASLKQTEQEKTILENAQTDYTKILQLINAGAAIPSFLLKPKGYAHPLPPTPDRNQVVLAIEQIRSSLTSNTHHLSLLNGQLASAQSQVNSLHSSVNTMEKQLEEAISSIHEATKHFAQIFYQVQPIFFTKVPISAGFAKVIQQLSTVSIQKPAFWTSMDHAIAMFSEQYQKFENAKSAFDKAMQDLNQANLGLNSHISKFVLADSNPTYAIAEALYLKTKKEHDDHPTHYYEGECEGEYSEPIPCRKTDHDYEKYKKAFESAQSTLNKKAPAVYTAAPPLLSGVAAFRNLQEVFANYSILLPACPAAAEFITFYNSRYVPSYMTEIAPLPDSSTITSEEIFFQKQPGQNVTYYTLVSDFSHHHTDWPQSALFEEVNELIDYYHAIWSSVGCQ